MHTHTCICTYVNTQVHTHAHMSIDTCTCTLTHMYTHKHVHTHMHAHTHAVLSPTQISTHEHTFIRCGSGKGTPGEYSRSRGLWGGEWEGKEWG